MASSLTQLLDTYSVSHQNPTNQKIHKVAVPLIMFSILGLSSLVVIGTVKLSWLMILLAGLYYLQFKKLKVFLIIYAQVIAMMLIIQANPFSTVWFYLTVFILAWIAQFVGHHMEGRKPSFLQDLQFLLIGPIWIFKGLL
jgi:uncharacterized membrane protein YGL010W